MSLLSFLRKRITRWVGVEHRHFTELSGSVLGGTRAVCPRCRRGRLLRDPDLPDRRTCNDPDCGLHLGLEELARTFAVVGASAAEVAARERRHALVLFGGAEILVICAAAWAIWTGSWTTLLGAALLAVVICATALVARYRAWQIEGARMFERKAPFGAYLRWELGGVLGRREGKVG